MIKTPLSIALGGAFWTPGATILGSSSQNLTQLVKSLFSLGEQGFAYDPNDLTTLYQNAAGTIPVTAAGQPVGLMKDKSGRNNHAFQTVSASRPILQRNATTGAYYLAFDGVDDFLKTSNIDFTGTDEMSLFAGLRKMSDTVNTEFVGLNSNGIASFYITTGRGNGSAVAFSSKGSTAGTELYVNQGLAPVSSVLTAKAKISAPLQYLKLNSVSAQISVSQGTGNYGNHPLYIGRREGTGLSFNGHIYGLIGIGRLTIDSETAALEKYIAKNTGVTLNV